MPNNSVWAQSLKTICKSNYFTLLIIYKSEYNGIKRFIAFNGSTLLQNHRVFKSYIFTL